MLYSFRKLTFEDVALVAPGGYLRSSLVNEAVSQLQLPSLGVHLVLKSFDAPFIVSHLFSLSLEELLVLDHQSLDLGLKPIVLLPEGGTLRGLLGDLVVAAVDLLLTLLPPARHDQVVLAGLAQLARYVVRRLALELQLLLRHLPLYVTGVGKESLDTVFFALR